MAEPLAVAYFGDGMDPLAVHAATEEAVARARDAGGATLLEFVSYRVAGQFEGDRATYQPQEEIHRWWAREPLGALERTAREAGVEEARLRAPVRRVTAPHTPVPFSPPLEDAYLPLPGRIEAEVRRLVNG